MKQPWVSSRRALKRMETKGHIRESSFRPKLPSFKKWGGLRGHSFVETERTEFVMDGVRYVVEGEGNKKRIYHDIH